MATFVDPVADAAEAYEGLRGLAHATRAFEDPADTYRVLGEVSGSVRCCGRSWTSCLALMLITATSRSPMTAC